MTGLLIGTALFLVISSFTGAAVFLNSCDLNSLKPVEVGQNSFVFAADGSLLGSIPAERNRQPVSLDQISKWVPTATIAIEDRRFYKHGGLDYFGIVRALYADIRAGKVVQGGSTITQQLVRNLYISNKSQTLGRKTTEACLAIKLARKKSKQWILAAYMNQVYYGNHAYGIEAAAQTYFSRPARRLTLDQSALLAGLPQAPSRFDPFQRPAEAIARRDDVLRAMLNNGDITSSQYANAVAKRHLRLKAGRLYTRIREPYFFSYVREALQKQYGANTVRSGGLKVYTTIDPRLQRFALDAIKRTLPYSSDPAAAIVSINPSNGAIRAMTEISPGNPKNQVNFASSARRQPGSTFKTIVLTTAVSQGLNPATTTYLSAPFKYDPTETGSCDTNPPTAWCPRDVRPHVSRADVDRTGDACVRQHRVRAAVARRRAGEHRRHGVPPRREDRPPHERRRVRAVDGARLSGGHADGHGLRLRDARGGRRLLDADGDPEGRPAGREGGYGGGLGRAAAQAGRARLGRRRGRAHSRREHDAGHRCRGVLRQDLRRQDGHHGQLRGRMVLRHGARARSHDLDRLSER